MGNWTPRDGMPRPNTKLKDDEPYLASDYIDQTSCTWNRNKLEAISAAMDVDITKKVNSTFYLLVMYL